jgi:hypothetical protein
MPTSALPDSRGVEMNITGTSTETGTPRDLRPVRRVREDVRDGLGVVVFSAVASTTVALAMALGLTALTRLAG